MREYTKRSESQSRTLGNNPKASHQAPISDILQTYKNEMLRGLFIQRANIGNGSILQSRINTMPHEKIVENQLPHDRLGTFYTSTQREVGLNRTGLHDNPKSTTKQLREQTPIFAKAIQAMWMRHNRVRIKGHPSLLHSLTPSELTAITNAVNTGTLHTTANARGNINIHAIGYIHSYTDNSLIQVRALNQANRTIVLIGRGNDRGHVNAGIHIF